MWVTLFTWCLVAVLLTGCAAMKPLFGDTYVEGQKLYAPDPHPVQMNDIEWIIISHKNIDQYLPDIESGDLVIIGMDVEDYKDMSINTLRLLNYIKSQRSVLAAYREFYEPENP